MLGPGREDEPMVSETLIRTISIDQARQLRQQAQDLLQRLTADREQSERRTALSGRRDAMKAMTGRTALETAMASADEMVRTLDRVVAALEVQLRPAELPSRPAVQPTARSLPKPSRPKVAMPSPTLTLRKAGSIAAAL